MISSNVFSAESGISLTGSSMADGLPNNGMSNTYQRVSPEDLDVEIDGPAGECKPHGEMQQFDSAGPG